MKHWLEIEKDAFLYFDWFGKSKATFIAENIPKLSVLSINSTMIFSVNDKRDFLEICHEKINEIFNTKEVFQAYKLYLFANIMVENSFSRVESYRKVWKTLQKKRKLEGFNLGPEIKLEMNQQIYFTSIAEFKLSDLLTALEIVATNPRKFAMFASRKGIALDEKSIRSYFNLAFKEQSDRVKDQIDYFSLSVNLCPQEFIVFRWGDSSEEAELDLIFCEDFLVWLNEKL